MRVFRQPRFFVLFWLWYPCLILLDLDWQTIQGMLLGNSVVVLFCLFFLSIFQEGRIRREVRSRSMDNGPGKPAGQPDHYVRKAIIMLLLFLLVGLAVPLAVLGMETPRWLHLSLTRWSPFILLTTLVGLGVLAVALGHRRLQDTLAQGIGSQEQAGMFRDPRLLTICIYLSLATMMLSQHRGTVQHVFALVTLLVGIASLIQETIHHEVYIMVDHLPRKR